MIARAVVVPHPPLLVPELVTGAVSQTRPVRAACLAAAASLAEVAPDWVAVATDPAGPVSVPSGASGTFLGFGVDVQVTLGTGDAAPPDPRMPLPALVAGWLRERAGARAVTVRLLAPSASRAECVALGERLAAGREPVGLLVLGDGSCRHDERSPLRADERAKTFDAGVQHALADADHDALLGLDAALADELGATGWAAWQVLAAAARAQGGAWRARAELLVPFGVGYHVAVWERA